MKELVTFQFEEGRKVHTLERNGEVWFVAKNVCDILGLGNNTEALRNFPEDERGSLSITEGVMAKRKTITSLLVMLEMRKILTSVLLRLEILIYQIVD